uniref:Uncharacterized protein n=1 Tax=Arundo donax TaxID=35708 RepID=A0A0A9EBV4_ARUDO
MEAIWSSRSSLPPIAAGEVVGSGAEISRACVREGEARWCLPLSLSLSPFSLLSSRVCNHPSMSLS